MLSLLPVLVLALAADPGPWDDLPKLLAGLQSAWGPTLAACVKEPRWISLDVSKEGAKTQASFFPAGLGGRGPTPEEACLMKAALEVPPLPPSLERISLRVWTGAQAPEPFAAGAWKAPAATAQALLTSAQFGSCPDAPREVVVVFDQASEKQGRAYLLGYQFEGKPAGLRACLERQLNKVQVPPLGKGFGGLQVRVQIR